jgi:hypothetical protein
MATLGLGPWHVETSAWIQMECRRGKGTGQCLPMAEAHAAVDPLYS